MEGRTGGENIVDQEQRAAGLLPRQSGRLPGKTAFQHLGALLGVEVVQGGGGLGAYQPGKTGDLQGFGDAPCQFFGLIKPAFFEAVCMQGNGDHSPCYQLEFFQPMAEIKTKCPRQNRPVVVFGLAQQLAQKPLIGTIGIMGPRVCSQGLFGGIGWNLLPTSQAQCPRGTAPTVCTANLPEQSAI